jgi:tripartite-type tricarboxylate transporter receptor subunit TctC
MKQSLPVILLLSVFSLFPASAFGQASGKPLQIVAPNAAGGPNDLIARLLAPKLGDLLGQSIIVENRPSANGVVGAEIVARAAPDGSVIAIGNSGTHAINATLYRQLSYDPVRDFAPITELVSNGLVVVTHPRVPAKNVKELIELARRHQGKINVAVAGATGELAGNAIKVMSNVRMTNIPYKGGVPAIVAVISGESDLTITSYGGVIPHVNAGRMKAIGVTSSTRLALLPDVPTIAESGLAGYEVIMWYGLWAPARTPEAVVRRIYDATARALKMPDVRERLTADAYEVIGSTPEQFAALVKSEVEKYRKLIIESGMTRL